MKTIPGVLAVITAAALPWSTSVPSEFIWDDYVLILGNDWVLNSTPLLAPFLTNLWASLDRVSNYYRPLPIAFFGAVRGLFGLSPLAFDVASMVVHVACCLLVYALLKLLLERRAEAPNGSASWAACIGALLFTVHPIHVEPVAWASGVMDLLATLFCLGCVWLYAISRRSTAPIAPYAASVVLLALAMLSKETGITAVVLLIAHDVLFRQRETVRALVLRWTPIALVVGAYVLMRIVALGGFAPLRQEEHGFGWAIANIVPIAATYLRNLAWPHDLAVLYHLPERTHPGDARWIVDACLVAAVAAFAIWFCRKSSVAIFGIIWFAITLAPSLFAAVASDALWKGIGDRYLYLPSVGAAILASTLFAWAIRRSGSHPIRVLAIAGAVVVMLGVASAISYDRWRTEVSVMSHAVTRSPNLAVAHETFGVALLRAHRRPEASRELRIAAAMDASLPRMWLEMGIARATQGKPMAAVTNFLIALEEDPTYADAHFGLGLTYEQLGMSDAARAEYESVLLIQPGYDRARCRVAFIMAGSGNTRGAISFLQQAPAPAAGDTTLAECTRSIGQVK
jgi:Flp pilus assembly protein TadD